MYKPKDVIKSVIKSKELLEREHQAYHDLVRFVRWLANSYQIKGHWLLNKDDLTAECFFIIAKLSQRYLYKPYDEFLRLARTSMRNYMGTLRYKALLTHRKKEAYSIPLDDITNDDYNTLESYAKGKLADGNGNQKITYSTQSDALQEACMNPEQQLIAIQEFAEKVLKLSDYDKMILDAICGENKRLRMYMDMQRKRKNFVYNNPTISIDALVVARALCEDIQDIRKSFVRLQKALFVN